MRSGDAFAEDLRRLGLILLAAGIVSGFIQNELPAYTAFSALLGGIAAAGMGYYVHRTERVRESAGDEQ